jgi:putative phosphoribosyl transferase
VPLLAPLLRQPGDGASVECVVLALPRGGVPVAAEVASAFGAPLDVLVVRKLGLPSQPELAVGAVASGLEPDKPVQVLNEMVLSRTRLSAEQLDAVVEREVAELRRREGSYRGERPAVDVAGRHAVIIDDGLATGATARAAVLAVRARGPAAVILAVPVAPKPTLDALAEVADHVVCGAAPKRFVAVGRHYVDFRQLDDAQVRRLLGTG